MEGEKLGRAIFLLSIHQQQPLAAGERIAMPETLRWGEEDGDHEEDHDGKRNGTEWRGKNVEMRVLSCFVQTIQKSRKKQK
jgi:hypothetical protein